MTDKASAGDFHGQDFLKKKMLRKHKELMKVRATAEGETVEKAEPGRASPLLFEKQAAQSDEDHKKEKSRKLKKQQQSLLDSSCVGQEQEISDETEGNAPQKDKKKQKRSGSADKQSYVTCVRVNQHSVVDSQDGDADYVYVQQPVKKKRKRKLLEEGEVCEAPASETCDKSDNKGLKKKRKKKRCKTTQGAEEDAGETGNQSLVSSPEQKRQRKSTEEGGVAVPQHWHEDGDASSVMSEGSADVPSKFSKSAKAAKQSQKAPVQGRKPKSKALVTKKKSSKSDGRTPEPSASNRKDHKNSFLEMADLSELSLDDEECLDNSMASAEDLDSAKLELKEFIPHVKNISDNSIRKMAGRDLARFKRFKKQGIAVKFGRFTKKENDQIQKNIEEFLLVTGIENAEKLLFSHRYPEEQKTIQRLKTEHQFCEKLSEGIPRPWRLIYYRARKIYDPNNYKGKYSDEEKEKLLRYQARHGNDWKKISGMMSRTNQSLARKYSEIKSAVNYGPWSHEEVQKLVHAVKEVIRKRIEEEEADFLPSPETSSEHLPIEPEKLYQNLPWTEIETQVGTRYWRQCKQKWLTILRTRMNRGKQVVRGQEGLQMKVNLIKRLHELEVEDANDVKWTEVCNAIGDFPSSYIQAKFYKLKVSCVPFWQKKTFSEIVDYLYEEKLPEFEEELVKKKGRQLDSDISAAREHKAYLLSDIFDCTDDSD